MSATGESEPRGGDLLARGLLDSLEHPACVVDDDSRLLLVNEAWRTFGRDNGGSEEATGVGNRYLDVCARASGSDSDGATAVARGLTAVLAQRSARFEQQYPCHSPTEERWFSVRIAPVEFDEGHGAVIRHVDVTTPVAARSLVRRALTPDTASMIDRMHRDGASPHTIAAALNRAGAPSPSGSRWVAHTVARYLAD